jgi:hypothetical protein
MLIEMTITGLALDPQSGSPVVILKDEAKDKSLPIWIGLLEASSIAMMLEGVELSRPMTHDLIRNMLRELDATVDKVVISDLVDSTYYARIYFTVNGKTYDIDARPSDSMAIALRTKAKILVDEQVLTASRSMVVSPDSDLSDEDKMKQFLEGLDPDSFKYKT